MTLESTHSKRFTGVKCVINVLPVYMIQYNQQPGLERNEATVAKGLGT